MHCATTWLGVGKLFHKDWQVWSGLTSAWKEMQLFIGPRGRRQMCSSTLGRRLSWHTLVTFGSRIHPTRHERVVTTESKSILSFHRYVAPYIIPTEYILNPPRVVTSRCRCLHSPASYRYKSAYKYSQSSTGRLWDGSYLDLLTPRKFQTNESILKMLLSFYRSLTIGLRLVQRRTEVHSWIHPTDSQAF